MKRVQVLAGHFAGYYVLQCTSARSTNASCTVADLSCLLTELGLFVEPLVDVILV